MVPCKMYVSLQGGGATMEEDTVGLPRPIAASDRGIENG